MTIINNRLSELCVKNDRKINKIEQENDELRNLLEDIVNLKGIIDQNKKENEGWKAKDQEILILQEEARMKKEKRIRENENKLIDIRKDY